MENINKQPTFEIVVDDGRRKIPIRNKLGEEVGIFVFQPTDVGIIERYNDLVTKLPEITAPLEHVNINPDGTANSDSPAEVEALREATKRLFEACDYMLGGNASEAFFGQVNPFSPVDGNFYCENVLNKIGEFISQQHDRETKKIAKRIAKYTQGYTGGGKPNRAQRRYNNKHRR